MNNEICLRIMVGFLFLSIVSIQVYYHRLAGEIGNYKELKQKPFLSILIAFIGTFNLFLIAEFAVLGGRLFRWASIGLLLLTRWGGVIVGIIGLILFFRVHQVLGKNFSYTTRIQEEQVLIIDGPYRFVQHPMYSAFLLFSIAFFLITANLLVGLFWVIGVFLVIFVRIQREEEGLREKFGKVYEEYSQKTAKIIPGVW